MFESFPLEGALKVMDSASEVPEKRATSYAAARAMRLGPCLGFGKDGTVFQTVGSPMGASAIKVFHREDLFRRELAAYVRLTEHRVAGTDRIGGHNIPAILNRDSTLLVIEMSIVARPFTLDFAGAYLDGTGPVFDEEIRAMALAGWQERFGSNWPRARQIIVAFAQMGIDLTDPSPTNIGCVDG